MTGTLRLSITRKDSDDRVCGVSYENGDSVELGYWLAEAEWAGAMGVKQRAPSPLTPSLYRGTGRLSPAMLRAMTLRDASSKDWLLHSWKNG